MHEASIIMGVIDTVTKQCVKEGYSKINTIRLRIGKASNILPDALLFAFDIVKQDSIAESAELLIETVALGGRIFARSEPLRIGSPRWGSSQFRLL